MGKEFFLFSHPPLYQYFLVYPNTFKTNQSGLNNLNYPALQIYRFSGCNGGCLASISKFCITVAILYHKQEFCQYLKRNAKRKARREIPHRAFP